MTPIPKSLSYLEMLPCWEVEIESWFYPIEFFVCFFEMKKWKQFKIQRKR